jgi:hypothetical protein
MTIMRRMIAGGAGIAALAAAAPAAAQYAYPYGYSQYGYSQYGYANPYAQNMTQVAAQRCSMAVQQRLSSRTSGGISGIIGSLLGVNTTTQGRVLSITQIDPDRTEIQVRGLATSGRYAGGYSPYGIGAYGAYGYSYQPDLKFRCDVDYRGYIRDIDIERR